MPSHSPQKKPISMSTTITSRRHFYRLASLDRPDQAVIRRPALSRCVRLALLAMFTHAFTQQAYQSLGNRDNSSHFSFNLFSPFPYRPPRSNSYPTASAVASCSPGSPGNAHTCCYSTSLPITWTWRRSTRWETRSTTLREDSF